MPLKHLRVCPEPCGRVRWAPCSIGCQVPPDHVKSSWLENLQEGAGTLQIPRWVSADTRPTLKIIPEDAGAATRDAPQ